MRADELVEMIRAGMESKGYGMGAMSEELGVSRSKLYRALHPESVLSMDISMFFGLMSRIGYVVDIKEVGVEDEG